MRRLGLLALLAIAAVGAGAGWLDSQISRPYSGRRAEKVFVDIPRGASRWDIAGILRHDDVIRNRLAFGLYSQWHFRKPLQAGEYLFDHPLDSREAFWKIAHGEIFVQTITVPERWTRSTASRTKRLAQELADPLNRAILRWKAISRGVASTPTIKLFRIISSARSADSKMARSYC